MGCSTAVGLGGGQHAVAAGERPAGAERHDRGRAQAGEDDGRVLRRRCAGEHDRFALAHEERVGVAKRCRGPAGVRSGVVSSTGHVGVRTIGHRVELVDARGDRSWRLRGDVRQLRSRPRIDGDHRAVAAEREHDRGRRPWSGSRGDPGDALLLERGSHEVAGDVVAERRGDRGRDPEARRTHRGDGATPGERSRSAANRSSPSAGSDSSPTNVRSRKTGLTTTSSGTTARG